MDPSGEQQQFTPEQIAAALTTARERDRAPARLQAEILAMYRDRDVRRRGWRPQGALGGARPRLAFGGALGGALAAAILALVLVLPGGTPGAPSFAQAAALGLRGPDLNLPAPMPIPANRNDLNV